MAIMKYETKITLYNSYFDVNDNLKIQSILAIFQDVASIHAGLIGVGYEEMKDKNLYWVLSRVKFDIVSMPHIDQTVIVKTWPHKKGLVDFDRDYLICDEDNNVLIKGTSKWCVIDATTRRFVRPDSVNYIGEYCEDINYEEKFNKTEIVDKSNTNILNHKVAFFDLDHNGHMNNTNYAILVANAINNKNISHFQINYINESRLDDNIELYYLNDNDGEHLTGYNGDKIIFSTLSK